MGVLGKPEHERFCQAVHAHLLDGKSRGEARTLAYQETVALETSEGVNDADNARKLANQSHIKARIQEISDVAAKVVGIDRAWLLLQARKEYDRLAAFNPHDCLDETGAIDIAKLSRKHLGMLTIEVIEGDKLKLRGPTRMEMKALLDFIARVGGFEAPQKVATTDAAGNDLPPMTDADRARMIEAIFAKSKSTATP